MNISVVIPTSKRPLLLLRCLESIIQQDYPANEFEIIVVSDGIDHKAGHLCNKLRKMYPHTQILFIESYERGGPAKARNRGWRIASGELIVFTDDDCIASATWLKMHWESYLKTGGAITAFSGRVSVPLPPAPTDFARNTAHLETADFITANCACAKKALEITGGFDEGFTMAWREDSDLHFALLQSSVPVLKNEALITHPVRAAPWGVSLKEQRKTMFNALLYKKYPQLYEKHIKSKPPLNYYVMILAPLLSLVFALLHYPVMCMLVLLVWCIQWWRFALMRLRNNSVKASHVAEMFFTSACIPFLSVYWNLYGSLKFKKLLL